jgi:hypothetical protein
MDARPPECAVQCLIVLIGMGAGILFAGAILWHGAAAFIYTGRER